jgi:hypothetical protein
MPRSTPTSLLLDDLVRNARQASDSAYLVSVALIAAVIICVFFGIGLSLIAVQTKEPMSSTVAVGDRGTEVTLPYSEVLLRQDGTAPPPTGTDVAPAAAAEFPRVPPVGGEPIAGEAATADNATRVPALAPAANEAPPGAAPSPSGTQPPEKPTARGDTNSPPATGAEVADLLARGDSFILVGDVISARVFYARAFDAGDGRAALRMGATFDPAFLSRAGLADTTGDPAQARAWYHRALELGATAAGHRHKGVDVR